MFMEYLNEGIQGNAPPLAVGQVRDRRYMDEPGHYRKEQRGLKYRKQVRSPIYVFTSLETSG